MWSITNPGAAEAPLAAITVDVLVRADVINVSSQAGSFIGASAAFVVGCGIAVVVSMVTAPKPDAELVGLTWSLTDKDARAGVEAGVRNSWWEAPNILGGIVIAVVVVLYIIFA